MIVGSTQLQLYIVKVKAWACTWVRIRVSVEGRLKGVKSVSQVQLEMKGRSQK